jgi:cytoplasmic tRNA 2-thiolation protein 1
MHLSSETKEKIPRVGKCARCGYISSQALCKACVLLEGLNKGRPKVDISQYCNSTPSSCDEGLRQ